MNVNLNKFRSFAEETCNMQHNSAEAEHSPKETFTRLATTDSSPLELMQNLWILTNSEAALKKHTNAAHDSVEALKCNKSVYSILWFNNPFTTFAEIDFPSVTLVFDDVQISPHNTKQTDEAPKSHNSGSSLIWICRKIYAACNIISNYRLLGF